MGACLRALASRRPRLRMRSRRAKKAAIGRCGAAPRRRLSRDSGSRDPSRSSRDVRRCFRFVRRSSFVVRAFVRSFVVFFSGRGGSKSKRTQQLPQGIGPGIGQSANRQSQPSPQAPFFAFHTHLAKQSPSNNSPSCAAGRKRPADHGWIRGNRSAGLSSSSTSLAVGHDWPLRTCPHRGLFAPRSSFPPTTLALPMKQRAGINSPRPVRATALG